MTPYEYDRVQWDVPRRRAGAPWVAYLVMGAVYLYILVSPATRRALSGQDGPLVQIFFIVSIGAVVVMLTIRAVRELEARRRL